MNDLLSLVAGRIEDDSIDLASKAGSIEARVAGGASRDSRRDVAEIEAHVSERGAAAFRFDRHGFATLTVRRRTYQCGRFTTPTLAELAKAAWRPRRLRLVVLGGASPLLDIGSLQAWSAKGTVFQIASQFNALESPGPYVPPIADYYFDPTQGPRASISAFPGTLLRQYAAPGPRGVRFPQQTGGRQIDLLHDAIGAGRVKEGYLLGEAIKPPDSSASDADAVVDRLESRLRQIRIGLHESAEVRLGHDWHGAVPSRWPRIDQVFTSTIAGGHYGAEAALGRDRFERVAEVLLRAAYLGTLRSAIALDRDRVVLTLIGGGVFGNPLPLIWRSILWAASECERENEKRSGMAVPERDLEVHVNARDAIGTLRDIPWRGDLAMWKDRVTWVEFASRNRVRVEVASADDRSIWTALATSRSTDAPSSRRDRAETQRTTRGITTPEDHLRARVPHWVAKAAEATRRDRTGTARERLSRHRARLENARPPKSGDLTVSWAGDFEAVDLMLLRHYPRQYARDPDRRTRKVRLVFGTAKSASRAIATLRARLARLEADGVIRSPVAEASPP